MKLDFETIVIFVSFITSFFAVFLSNGIMSLSPSLYYNCYKSNTFCLNVEHI